MPMSAKIERVKQAASDLEAIEGIDPEVFQHFVANAARQLRAPFLVHHSPADAARLLRETLARARQYQGTAPRVDYAIEGRRVHLWTTMPDQPFIVDTLRLMLKNAGWEYIAGFNLMVGVRRDENGAIVDIGPDAGPLESLTYFEAEVSDPRDVEAAAERLRGSLTLAQAMVADFHAITDLVDRVSVRLKRRVAQMPHLADDLRETADFLQWLLNDNFVFMGAAMGEERLGIARQELSRIWPCDDLFTWNGDRAEQLVCVRKGHLESRLHRAGRVDEIKVRIPNADGSYEELLLQGMFTYRAVTQPSRQVPWLRRMLSHILSAEDSQPGTYRYKGIANVFDSLPTEFLFTADEDEVAGIIERVLEAEIQQDARAYVVQRSQDDVTFALVAMPKSRFSEGLRERMEGLLLDATGATYCDHGVFVGRFDTMLVHFYLTGSRKLSDEDIDELLARLTDLATPWEERLIGAATERFGSARASELMARYATAFDESYRLYNDPARAVSDMEIMERLGERKPLLADLFRDKDGRINLRVYQARDVLLSDMLPVLDDFGLIIIDQYSNTVEVRDGPSINLDTFRLAGVWGVPDDKVMAQAAELVAGVEAVFAHDMDDDVLNRVLLRAAIPWQAVDMIRAYLGYARQLGLGYTLVRLQELLLAQPALASKLWELFEARFNPDLPGDRAARYAEVADEYLLLLRGVDDHDQDVVFRTLYNLVDSSLRTNFYRPDRKMWSISFKVDCSKVRHMPEPRMKYEIYVHHRAVEGLHIRGGDIARGGIRWSDRSDYRQEILDLVTTQMVKNVLIVPEGAKGGFFLKKSPSDRAERRKRADDMYEVLIRGMLDVTDNIVDGKVVHPPGVVRHDGDDPYLVVAADKGTAHLSDRANAISRAYGFWLDDAFASGGSHGYDHKAVGITARGAWRTVARHFRELGMDPYSQDFTAIGIGDPSGDVFGNGVIETPHMRLQAAFNHLHVFLDPNPDPRRSYEERVRLFKAARGWDAYDTSLLSEGGGIYSRRAKSIKLSPQAQKMLGTLESELPVDAVIRLILRMKVDLFWNGGIGTYVKASWESHQQAKDPTNDELRINADELRCRIVGEGGNLGFTPEARIEYALKGGRLNTDAIDNSGGVDMSDHEVNLKILLGPVVARGDLTMEARNELLRSLTDTVAEQVLQNNDIHGRQISLDEIRSARDPLFFFPTIQWVVGRSGHSIADLHLPSHDALKRRAASRQGLTRPELAVLQAHVKMHVFKDLMQDDPALIPDFDTKVREYFPPAIRQAYADEIPRHMLYKHIGMTVVTTEVFGHAGATFFPSLMELTGASAARVAAAWFRAMELVEVARFRERLKATTRDQTARYRAWIALTDAALRLVATWLSPGEPEVTPEELDAVRDVLRRLPKVRGTVHSDRIQGRRKNYATAGISKEISSRLAALGELTVAREIHRLHTAHPDERIGQTIVRYLAIGEASRLLPAVRALELRRTRERWDPVAMAILRNRYLGLIRKLVEVVPVGPEVRLGVDRLARRLAREGTGVLAPLQHEMDRILGDAPDLPTLLVAEERVYAWIARFEAAPRP
ncbi:MAG: hypothetical protein D6798_10595 [Deltaproteobacteria bacterium]|nr:MAG: hypothetical protein D6798_10595 [Deltaproteobacteria bacterium]